MINSDGRVIIAPVNDVLSINLSTPIFNKAVAINIYIPSLRANDIHTKQVETIDFIISLFLCIIYFFIGTKCLFLSTLFPAIHYLFDIASFGILADCQAAAIAWGCQFLHP